MGPGGIVGADPFKYRGAVMQGVGHDVNLRLVPLNQFTVKPDIFGVFDIGMLPLVIKWIGKESLWRQPWALRHFPHE